MSAQVAADLRAAADVLERDGWTQGTYDDDAGCHCVIGAIRVVLGLKKYDRIPLALAVRWHALEDSIGASATDWNDEPGRTADEVIAALRAAADAAEASDD